MKQRKKMGGKLLALLLVLCIGVSLFPVAAGAGAGGGFPERCERLLWSLRMGQRNLHPLRISLRGQKHIWKIPPAAERPPI